MGRLFKVCSWNVKGLKSPAKYRRFWNFVMKNKDVLVWCIQEHHLDVGSARKQGFGKYLVFYADSPQGDSGVCTMVHRDLCPVQVFVHPSGRLHMMKIFFEQQEFYIINVYAANEAKSRARLWASCASLQLEFPAFLLGDFNMVVDLKDRAWPSATLMGKEKAKWNALIDQWAFQDTWHLGPWMRQSGHTYFSLQYANSSARLDRCYVSHFADWMHHTHQVVVGTFSVLSDHYPLFLSWQGSLSTGSVPKGNKKVADI